MIIATLIIFFYLAIIIGSIGLLIWAINDRIKEKKREEKEHKDYKKY
ncbi:hypothetical protein H8S20_10985 [Clostridium sp. NSJ-6]|uniref:Uncharacterized protein n=1 Tax=Clostridium hominis TaxID=2763036 RepID=A0ABR7DDH9_9CLOT|nr:hypothetical protein [Clostridium hominis]MBC5629413.1 hypothetical protein [Clostridium hominis]MDU2671311.1 hypothetical protein [Clostridium sp.]